MAKKKPLSSNTIVVNKKARFDYFIEEEFEAGIVLDGWEVKSLRAGRVQITESYVFIKKEEAFIVGAHITPLPTASSHIIPDSTRVRKLLLHRHQINRLFGAVERKGYALVALNLHWTKGRAKLSLGLAKGKKTHDKRASIKERDWNRDKQRIIKHG